MSEIKTTDQVVDELSNEIETNAHLSVGGGSLNSQTINVMSGLNINGGTPLLPQNEDNMGYLFFTRTDMNLSYDNIRTFPKFNALTDNDPNSIGKAIKTMLSRRKRMRFESTDVRSDNVLRPSDDDYKALTKTQKKIVDDNVANASIDSNIMSENSAFIWLLSNTCLTFTGWPQHAVDYFVSEAGNLKQQRAHVDSHVGDFGVWDASATFTNMEGDVLTSLFSYMVNYAEEVQRGELTPWPNNLIDDTCDYEMRVYRIVLDHTKQRVTHIGSTIGVTPTVDPTGSIMNYDVKNPMADSPKEIQMGFKCHGFEYDNFELIDEFNETVKNADNRFRILDKPEVLLLLEDKKNRKLTYKDVSLYRVYPNEVGLFTNLNPYIFMHPKRGALFIWLANEEQFLNVFPEGQ